MSSLQDQQNDGTSNQIQKMVKNKLSWSKSVLGVEGAVKWQVCCVDGTCDVGGRKVQSAGDSGDL